MINKDIVADLVGIGGAGLLCFVLRTWLVGRASRKWPQTDGVLDRSAVKELVLHHGPWRNYTRFALNVRYRYVVDGKEFTGTRLMIGGTEYGTRRDALDESRQLWHEDRLAVYYDPANPSRSCLERGVGNEINRLIVIGLCAVAWAVMILFFP